MTNRSERFILAQDDVLHDTYCEIKGNIRYYATEEKMLDAAESFLVSCGRRKLLYETNEYHLVYIIT